jgi:DNA-binding MarR family transcriptional regulator
MKRVSLPQDGLSILSRQVFTLNGLLLSGGKTVAAACGITVAQWHVLARANYMPRTAADIARYIGISRQAVQRTADSLVDEGLLRFVPNPNDKRAPLAKVTPKGARVLESVYKADAVWSRNVLRRLEGIDLAAASAVLDQVIPILSSDLGGRHEEA